MSVGDVVDRFLRQAVDFFPAAQVLLQHVVLEQRFFDLTLEFIADFDGLARVHSRLLCFELLEVVRGALVDQLLNLHVPAHAVQLAFALLHFGLVLVDLPLDFCVLRLQLLPLFLEALVL